MRSPFQYGVSGLLIATTVCAVFVAGLAYFRKPISDARQIQTNDTADRVHELLGTPTIVFNSDAELRGSILRPMSFVFSDTRDTVFDLPISKLPAVKNYAEWFEYTPTAGHLVYYGDDGVEVVYWGGT